MNLSSIKKSIDLKLVLLLAAFYTLFDIIYLIKMWYMDTFMMGNIRQNWYQVIVFNILFDWIIVVTYMTIIAISTRRLLQKNYSWVRIFLLHTLFSILIGLVIRIVFDIQGILAGHIKFEDYTIKESVDRMILVLDLNFLIYFAMIFIIYTYYYLKQVKEAQSKSALLETQLVNTRMKMLSSQLQPHFLFNTLNSISVLVGIDAKKARDTIADLSDFLREILYSGDSPTVSLEKELKNLEHYINIINVRFSDDLIIEKEIEEGLLQLQVPPLLLQPVIENSVKHGYSYDHTSLKIKIRIFCKDRNLVIVVANNGQLLTMDQQELYKKGVGLTNINDRLSNLYGDKYFFEIKNSDKGKGVETTIKIPV